MRREGGSDESPDDVEVIGEEAPEARAQRGRPPFPWWVPLVLLIAAVALVVALDRFLGEEETADRASPEPASRASPAPRSLTAPPTGRFLLSLHRGGAAASPGAVIGTDLEPIQLSPLGSDLLLAGRPPRVGPSGRLFGGWRELSVQGTERVQQGLGGEQPRRRVTRVGSGEKLVEARWSPLAEQVAYRTDGGSICTRGMVGTSRRVCVDVGGRAIATSGNGLAWAPDAESIVLGGAGIRQFDVQEGRLSVLVPEGGGPSVRDELGRIEALPVTGWAPSGRYVAASAVLESGGGHWAVSSRDVPVVFDSEGQLVTVGRADTGSPLWVPPRWSPEDDLLAYVVGLGDADGDGTADELAVLILDPSTGGDRRVLSFETSDTWGVVDLEWSPDGKHLAVAKGVGTSARIEIWIVDPLGDRRPGAIESSLIRLADDNPLADWGPTSVELTTAQRRLAERRASDLGISVGDYVSGLLDEGL